jgi:lipocalin
LTPRHFTDQASIFHEYELGKLDRLLSHMLVGGPLVAALWVLTPDAGAPGGGDAVRPRRR